MEDNWGNQVSSLRESVKKRGSCKGAAIHRGLEHGSRTSTVKAVTRERLVKIQQAGKCLPDAAVICKVWRLAVAL
jgi:hypothetical protein